MDQHRLVRELALSWHAQEEMHLAWETTGAEREEHLREMHAATAALHALQHDDWVEAA